MRPRRDVLVPFLDLGPQSHVLAVEHITLPLQAADLLVLLGPEMTHLADRVRLLGLQRLDLPVQVHDRLQVLFVVHLLEGQQTRDVRTFSDQLVLQALVLLLEIMEFPAGLDQIGVVGEVPGIQILIGLAVLDDVRDGVREVVLHSRP